MGLSQIHHHDLIRGSPFFNKNKTDRNTLDKGWWIAIIMMGKGVFKEHKWAKDGGQIRVPIFNNPNQTSSNRPLVVLQQVDLLQELIT